MDMKQQIQTALQELNDIKNREADYGQINKLQNIINKFDHVARTARLMAEDIAAKEGTSADEVFDRYGEKA